MSILRVVYRSGEETCICFQSAAGTLSVAVPEEAELPYGILYLNPLCGMDGYRLTGKLELSLSNLIMNIIIRKLFD